MADETIIIDVVLNTKDQVENAARLRTAIDELKKTQEDLRKNGEANSVQFEANAAALRDLQGQYRQATKDIDNVNKQIQAETGSIAANRAELARLTAEYIKLGKPTAEQTARIKSLSDQLKTQEAAIGDTRRNVGNYGDALKSLGGALPIVGKGMDTFNKISAANPIGLVVLAVVSLIDIFKKFQPVVDAISVGMSIMNNIFDVVQNTIAKVFEGITQILSGNFTEGFNTIGGAIGGVGDAFSQAAKEGIRYAETLKEIEDLNARNAVFFAQQEKQIAVLSRSLRDRTKSEEERLKIADEITKVENERFERENQIAQLTAQNERIALGNALLRKGVTLDEIRNTQDIVKLAQDRAVSDDLINRYVDARVSAINKETESESRLEAIQVRRNQILEQGEEKRRKAAEDKRKADEDELKRQQALAAQREKDLNDFINQQNKQIDELRKRRAAEEEAQKVIDDFNEQAKKDAEQEQRDLLAGLEFEFFIEEEKTRFAKEEAAKRQQIRDAELDAAFELANALTGLLQAVALGSEQNAELQKAIAVFQIAISSAEALANIVTVATAPSADNIASGGLAIPIKIAALSATVLANIARANAILNSAPKQFYEGGYTGDGNPREESTAVGKRPYIYHKQEYIIPHKLLAEPVVSAFVSNIIEPKRKGKLPSGLPGMFDGGFATTNVRSEVNASLQSNALIKAIGMMRPVVQVSEINTVQQRVKVLDINSTL